MEIISEETGDSPKQVQRYIKMADLIPELLEKVDDGSMGFTPAVQIAYLKKKEQGTYFYIHCSLYNPYLNDIGCNPPHFYVPHYSATKITTLLGGTFNVFL